MSATQNSQEIVDIIPGSMAASPTTGRIMMLSKSNELLQFDVANNQALPSLGIGGQVPMKEIQAVDMAFDGTRLYILTDKWVVEVWEIFQNRSIPRARLKVIGGLEQTENSAKKNNYQKLIAISERSGSVVIVNCTQVNNSIVFIDPVSLSIINTIYLRHSDYKVSKQLSGILIKIAPQLEKLKCSIKFESFFENCLMTTQTFGKMKSNKITTQDFKEQFLDHFFDKELSENEKLLLIEFLDQKSDNILSESEFYYLFESLNYIPKSQLQSQTFNNLVGLNEKCFNLLVTVNNFFKTSQVTLEGAFKMFDKSKSGRLTDQQFLQLLEWVCQFKINEEEKVALMDFLDKNNDKELEFKEFAEILNVASNESMAQIQNNVNSRNNLMLCFQKAFEMGIDVEQKFFDQDTLIQGSIDRNVFIQLLKQFPIGLVDDEINYILHKQVKYSDTGHINYLAFINDPIFKQLKQKYYLKNEFSKQNEAVDPPEDSYQMQKIVIENIIYLEDFDIFVYTLQNPQTSLIFISTTKNVKEFQQKQQQGSSGSSFDSAKSELFENKLLARLDGHESNLPPTIMYCYESGCLVSGEKIQIKSDKQEKKKCDLKNELNFKRSQGSLSNLL
eukprot:TRINITY_DN29223_c0_g1_i2.p1 TRINITY_DN29223_c0_g1~~TRINITY_DN29223_c0_g1_i2.p1  ORF type:complete len:616 (-),score=92.06 TRINITY_DN29223_c0_g1_i2:212-2059(-)